MLQVHAEVAAALRSGAPVVALESTLISHGLPRPDNLRVAREIEAAVREEGAVPATIAVVGGAVRVGLDDAALEEVASTEGVVKCSTRDLPIAAARGATGATTVAATALLAHQAGIELFATGGMGGVHREARSTWDESADLVGLARTPITLVCAGVKSILDVPATLERIETLGISLVGYGTDRFPGFYLRDSGLPVPWRVDSPGEVVAILRARAMLDLEQGALVVANPIAEADELDADLHDETLAEALEAAHAAGITGRDVTPFLLSRFHERTGGASLTANVALVMANARLAARIAVAAAAG